MIVNHDRRWPSEYKSPYNSRRTEWRVRTVPNLAPIVQGDFVTEALDPAALAARLRLFEAEHKKVFDGALKEVEDGCKNGHWIWSVFPQAAGIPESFGTASSKISRRFSILCFDEAVAFLEHPILGLHYVEIVEAIRVKIEEKDQHRLGGLKEIFGDDYKKVISSLTLFRRAAKVSSVAGYIWVEEEDTLFKLLTPVRLPDNTPSDPDRFKMRDTRRDLTSGISSPLALIDDSTQSWRTSNPVTSLRSSTGAWKESLNGDWTLFRQPDISNGLDRITGTRPWTAPCRVGQQVKPPRMKATLNLDRNHGGAMPGGVDN